VEATVGNQEREDEKFRVLLPHWIEHNQEHVEEFLRWAERAGEAEDHIRAAARLIEEANQALEAALAQLDS
jgi:hypothetical protein